MKSIAWVNMEVPIEKGKIEYNSEDSLRDYDLVVFNPSMPYYDRINFSNGGSCLSIEGTSQFGKSSSHWSRELASALKCGKTVFVVLDSYKEDQAATGSTMTEKRRINYSTTAINNYGLIPGKLGVKNARGKVMAVKDPAFKSLFDSIKDIVEYRVILESSASMRVAFAAKDGTPVGGVLKFQDFLGSLVLLPYVDFTEIKDGFRRAWKKKASDVFNALVGQLVAIDRALKSSGEVTPPPDWLSGFARPKTISEIDGNMDKIDSKMEELRSQREEQSLRKMDILEYRHLLYETGKPLERAIEKVLRLLGYKVETLRIGDLEIDHVIVSPSGKRMIGESEGKDSSAIDISKFRQLESNIGEDFQREEVEQPAKGVLFGNGFRLSPPAMRAEQFTQKSLTNASRLGSALIRTADLYPIAVHLLDHPDDESFRAACRAAIDDTAGGIVCFPSITSPTVRNFSS